MKQPKRPYFCKSKQPIICHSENCFTLLGFIVKNLFLSALVVGIGFHAAVGFAADNLKNTQLESIKDGVSLSMGAGAKCGTISSWDLNAIVNAASDVAVNNGD